MKKYLVTITLLVSLCLSCTSSRIGKYVYLEIWRSGYRLHIDRHCPNFGKNGQVQYIETASLKDCQSFCPNCVTDEDAEYLMNLMRHNADSTNTDTLTEVSAQDNIKNLYEALKDEYDLGTEQEFRQSLGDENNRRNLYNSIKDDYDLGTEQDFNSSLGYNVNH